MPLSWTVYHPQAGTHIPNLKFVRSPTTKIKGNTKCRNWGGLGIRGHPRSPLMLPFNRAHMTSYSTSTETMHLSCTVFKYGEYLSKVAYFNDPHLHLAPPLEFRRDL